MGAPVSASMVGRDAELAELVDALDGPADVVLLSGDAGVGKTRLLSALRDRVLADGWRVLVGHCLDFGDSALPYLPISEVLGRAATEMPDLVDRVSSGHAALTRLLPGHRTRSVEASDADGSHATDRGDLFVAVHTLLDEAAADGPLLLVIEDAHWADQSTRELLGFLFTRPFANRVVVVASYRSDDLHRRHPLRRQVAEWARLPRVGRVSLGPLADDDVRALVAELAPDELDPRAVAAIVRRADGNAFFVEELVAAGEAAAAGEEDVPGDLADVLLVRVDQLSDTARDLVRIASVAGRRVRHDLLAMVADMPRVEFETAVRQAVELNLLVAGSTHYSFRHALLGEAVYDDLLPGERIRLHARYVEALVAGGLGTAAEIARQARRANDLDRAVTAGIEAGDEAMAVGGPDEAARHYEQVLELLEDRDRAERLEIDCSKLVVKAAAALVAGGNAVRALHLLRHQLDRLPSGAAPDPARCRMLIELADVTAIVESDLDPWEVSEQALRLAPDGDSPLRARALMTHARLIAFHGREDEAEGLATEALALAQRLSLPVLVSEVATTLSGLRVRSVEGSEQEALRRALATAVDRARDSGAMQAELRGRFLLGRSHQDSAEWDLATKWFASAIELGERMGLPWAPYVIESRWQAAWVRYTRGDWDAALDLTAMAADPSGPVVPRGLIEPIRLAILAGRGQLDGVAERLVRLRELWASEGGIAVFSSGVEIDLCALRGDAAGALAVYDDVVGLLSRIWQPHFAGKVRLAALAVSALARATPAASVAERPALLAQADRLLTDGQQVIAWIRDAHGSWGAEGVMWELLLAAEHTRMRWLTGIDAPSRDELLDAWAEAAEATHKLGHLPQMVRVAVARSQVMRLVGDVAAAHDEAELARGLARQMAAPALVAGLAAEPAPPRGDADPARLTAREAEILELVAEGRSNGEIGKQLFIATKTVSVHVSNILAKLGAASRTEAAAIARRDGLLSD